MPLDEFIINVYCEVCEDFMIPSRCGQGNVFEPGDFARHVRGGARWSRSYFSGTRRQSISSPSVEVREVVLCAGFSPASHDCKRRQVGGYLVQCQIQIYEKSRY